MNCGDYLRLLVTVGYRDWILGYEFDKLLESFAPCYSQYLIQKTIYRKIRKRRKLESIHE